MAAYPPPTITIFSGINYNTDFFYTDENEGILTAYVKKTGSIMTGQLRITMNDVNNPQLRLKNTNSGGAAGTICEGDTGVITAFTQGCSTGPNYVANNGYVKTVNSLAIATGANSPAVDTIPTMIVHSNQNVGIGILTPLNQLSLGTASTNSNINVAMSIQNNAGTYNYFGIGGTGLSGYWNNNFFINAQNDLVFNTNGQTATAIPRMIIKTTGMIGIGITNPQAVLDVNGDAQFTSNVMIGANSINGVGIFSTNSNPAGYCGITVGNDIFRGGNVYTAGSSSTYLKARNNLYFNTTCNMVFDTGANNLTNSTYTMILTSGGNLGIGTSTPNTQFEIWNGTASKIYLNSGATTRCFLNTNMFGIDIGNDVGTGKRVRFMPDNVQRVVMDDLGYTYIGMSPVTNPFGIRISGSDFENTIYQDNVSGANIGITCGNSNASIVLNNGVSWPTVIVNKTNQIITKNNSVTPQATGAAGYWYIDITAYRFPTQYNAIYFSCSTNSAGNTGYYSGTVIVNGIGNSIASIIAASSNIFLTWSWTGSILYLVVNVTTITVTAGAPLYYKCIG